MKSWSTLCGIVLCIGMGTFFSLTGFAANPVSEEYYPNYKIQTKRNKMIEILENVEASVRVGIQLTPGVFSELNSLFAIILPHFPKSPNNNIVYKQCNLTTKELMSDVTSYKYSLFKERCFSPIGQIVQQIQTKYTVKPEVIAKPEDGPAPLNVTFDARGSTDPSNDTIPSDNFFWYYKNIHGVNTPIGRGPVANYTFSDPGNHIVHLTVRSANQQTQGIFDGEKSLSINVAPESAQIVLYVDGKKADPDRLVKIGMQDGKSIVALDPTATRPTGARTITSYTWEITNNQKYSFTMSDVGSPKELLHEFPQQGIYRVKLEVTDNENNKINKIFQISISDPVAIIRVKPEEGTTSTQFVFDGSASYSVSAKIKKHQRQVFDPKGNQISFVDDKTLKQQFTIPGSYTIKLIVTDQGGSVSTDVWEMQVGSTPPVPSFVITPTTELKYPSRFILDAGGTIDDDLRSGSDELTFTRAFSSPEYIRIDTTQDESKRIVITVDQPGTYKVYLTVTDKFGESRKIEKELKVVSTLRPEMLITPLIGERGSEITFFAKVNKQVAFYERDFGDGKKQQTQEPKVVHSYAKAGIYKTVLRVLNEQQEENTLTKQVFVGQKELPLVGRVVKSTQENVELTPTGSCGEGTGAQPAYIVDRYQQLLFDATSSRSILGDAAGIRITFRPQNDEIYSKSVLNYKFTELGCQWVDIAVDDINVGKSSQARVWFDVHNALPIMQNLTLKFPQAKQQQTSIGVGSATASLSDENLALDTTLSSIIVKATIQGSRDPDGSISYYKWWYYPNNDDTRKEGFKITPAAITSVTFVIPKPGSPTEYAFVVEAFDNDGGKVNSEELLGKGPIVFFPPGEVQLDQPLVSLKVDSINVRAGEEVMFSTFATIPSERPDFEDTRMIKYDFDGDGIYDQTTKKTDMAHVYTKPGTYTPKVAVYYRDRVGVALGEKVTVIKAVTPRLLYAVHDRTILVRDVTLGDVEGTYLCMNEATCVGSGISNQANAFTSGAMVYTYDTYGEYMTHFAVIDGYGNELEKKDKLTIRSQTGFALLSIPESVPATSGGYDIALGSSMSNRWTAYIFDERNCTLDFDITADSNGDGDPMLDEDAHCNELIDHQFLPNAKTQEGILYRVIDGKVVEERLIFTFLDIQDQIVPEGYESVAKQIDELLAHAPTSSSDTYVSYYRDLLVNLRGSLGDASERSSLVIQLRDHVGTYPHVVPAPDKETVALLLLLLSNSTVQDAFGGSVYEIEKNNILVWFQEPTRTEVLTLFTKFERAEGNQTERKQYLDAIANLAAQQRDVGKIDEVDFNYIRTSLCALITYYDLPSKTCGTENISDGQPSPDNASPNNSSGKSSWLGKALKIVIYLVVILGLIFVGFIIFFAIKAKKQQQRESLGNDTNEEETTDKNNEGNNQ